MKLLKRNKTTVLGTIGWWELNRVAYNIIMLVVGWLSFFIGYVTIPVVYIFIGLGLNILFTTSWIGELVIIRPLKSDKARRIYTKSFIIVFYGYSIISVLFYIYVPELLDWTFHIWMD